MFQYNNDIKFQKPFLKWVGGKTQIMSDIISTFPSSINNYHEPFVGGGSVLIAVLQLRRKGLLHIKGKVFASDININLINVYKQIQTNKDELYKRVVEFKNTYHNIKGNCVNRKPKNTEESLSSKESYYYWIRHCYNSSEKDNLEVAAMFIFMNKTCFRGVYREGPNGYNVPYGHHKKTPEMINKSDIDNIYDLIKDVEFISNGFDVSLNKIEKNDFVYLDPPYFPESKTSFTTYIRDGFNLEQHKSLFKLIKNLTCKFTMSNSNTEFVRESFTMYDTKKLQAKRAINSKEPGSVTTEIIVYNTKPNKSMIQYSSIENIGSHVPFVNSLNETLMHAIHSGLYCLQFFMGDSKQAWKRDNISVKDVEKTNDILSRYQMSIFTHFPLCVNMAGKAKLGHLAWSGDRQIDNILYTVIRSIEYELNILSKLNTKTGVVIHPGSYPNRKEGLDSIIKTINHITFPDNSYLLLENCAGEGNKLCRDLVELQHILENITKDKKKHVRVCIDTAHLWGQGDYEISKISEIDRLFDDFERVIGLEKFHLLHLNDSKANFGSKRDLHACLGKGEIWSDNTDTLKYLIDKCIELNISCIMETEITDISTICELYQDFGN